MQEEAKYLKERLQRLYRTPYLTHVAAPRVRPILDELAIRRDDVIVELGSGDGHFTVPIARRLDALASQGVVFACDFSRSLVDDIHQKATAEGIDDHVRAVCLADIKPRTLPFADERVNSVLAVNFLQYLPDPVPYMREIARILSPCGNLVVTDWHNNWRSRMTERPSWEIGLADLLPMFKSAGLEANLELDLNGFGWALRVIKPLFLFI